MTEPENKWACMECGHEQATDRGGCVACQSVRVVHVIFLEMHIGPDWRTAFQPPPKK